MKKILLWSLLIVCVCNTARAQNPQQDNKRLVSVISKPEKVEFSPTVSADGRFMIYETQNGDKWELYQSRQNDRGEWTEPTPLKNINEKCHFTAGPSLTSDGNTLFFTAFIEGVTESEDIYYAQRLNETDWSEPKPLGPPVNTQDEYEGFPSISSDGNSLYFIRVNPLNNYNRKAKESCFQIFVAPKQADGTWGTPAPLPATINRGCERDPRIMADNHTLIFSSIREGGQGKFDLYQSRLQHNGEWSEPTSLNFVNSAENDQAPCISASGNTMFYYSNQDIYEVDIPEQFRQMINITLQGGVYTNDQQPLQAAIKVVNNTTKEVFTAESNQADGKYSIVLAAGNSYSIIFSHAGYVGKNVNLDYSGQHTYLETKLDVILEERWTMLYSALDKDIHFPVTTFVSLRETEGAVLFSDSIRVNSYPKTFDMNASKHYVLNVSAPGYEPFEKNLFVGGDTTRQLNLINLIEHEKVKIAAEVTDIGTGSKKRVKVQYSNENRDEVIIADAGEVVSLRKGDRYQVVTNSEKGYAYAMKTVTAGQESTVDLPITELKEGAKLTLNHIYFETNSWQLDEQSALELRTIIELMKRNPEIVIQISAHTDNVGSDEYNVDLSEKRALSVTQHLTKNGIPENRLEAKGYGKSQPFADNDSEESRAKNRRVELLVLKVN
jgi:outer membrane protein OmpA-like peptidoglycan-associated protein